MSSTLTYKVPQKDNELSDHLKRILTDKYRLTEGRRILTRDDWSYIEGLSDAHIEDAYKLLELIDKHGEVEIELQY